jgi:hypothetical protein
MKREKEIKQEARKYFDDYMDGLKGEVLTVQQTFEDGAKWADRTLIEKACDWIQMNATKYINAIGGCMYFDVINSTKDFKKAMES